MLRHVFCELIQQRLQRGVGRFVRHTLSQPQIDDERQSRVLREFQWQVDIRAIPAKSRRCYSYNQIVLSVQLNRFSDYVRVRKEMCLPKLVGQHGDCLRVLSLDGVRRPESPP